MVQALKATGERQVATDLDDIRADHRARYAWVAERIDPQDQVLDAGCGTGYGAGILAGRAASVTAIDSDAATIDFARATWPRENLGFETGNLHFLSLPRDTLFDRVVAFEVIEHLLDPGIFLDRVWAHMHPGAMLYVSSPNETAIAHTVELNPYHIRHYTAADLAETVAAAGFRVVGTFHQETDAITEGSEARTLILSCERLSERPGTRTATPTKARLNATIADAEREMILRSNLIRALQGRIRRLQNTSDAVLRAIDAKFEAFRKANAERDKKDLSRLRISEAAFNAKFETYDKDLSRLRIKEAAAVAELLRAERDAAANATALSQTRDRLKASETAADLLRQRLNEANVVLGVQTSELKNLRTRNEHLRIVEQEHDRLQNERHRRLGSFDPERPTVMGVLRLLLRRKFFIGVLVRAPYYSMVNIRNVVAARLKSSQ